MRLFTAPSLNQLAELLHARQFNHTTINSPPNSLNNTSPLSPTTIVVQSKAMEQYLKWWLVKKQGIVANVEFPFPFHLISDLKKIIENANFDDSTNEVLHSPNLFAPLQSRWTFTSVLYELAEQIHKVEINHPLEKLALSLKPLVEKDSTVDIDSKKKTKIPLDFFQFGFQLAHLFDQYDFYRYDWLEKWESTSLNPTKWINSVQKNWQEVVWQKVRARHRELGSTLTRREELSALASQINLASRVTSTLPRKLSIFGVSYLPFCYLDFLNQISKTIEIDYYQLDIVGQLANSSSTPDSNIFNYFFKMLANQSIDFGKKIQSLSPSVVIAENRGVSLSRRAIHSVGILSLIRSVVHSLDKKEMKEEINNVKQTLLDISVSSTKTSTLKWLDLQIHNCPSMLREVEVLKNNLWSVLEFSSEEMGVNTDLDIGLEDILVLAPNIEEYAPYINSVFTSTPALGHHTTDHSLLSQSSLFKELEVVFQLFGSQFERSKLLAVWEGSLWQDHWGMTSKKMEWIKQWFDESKYHRGRKGGNSHNLFHLEASLNKIFNAYCTNMSGNSNFEATFQASQNKVQKQERLFQELSVEKKKTFGELLKAIRILDKYHQKVKKPQSLTSWVKLTQNLIDDCFFNLNHPAFFVIENKEKRELLEKDVLSLTDQLQKLVEEVSFHDLDALIDSQTFWWILKQSYTETMSRGFLEGRITFASMMPMRAIPFKVIALLGMNDFPRSDRSMSSSLLKEVRDGDRSRKKDDQLLFLETIMSATYLLHISYLGSTATDYSPLLPSSLLTNLMLSLSEQLTISPKKLQDQLTLKHPLRETDSQVKGLGFFYRNYSKSDFLLKQFKEKKIISYWEELLDTKKYFSSELPTDPVELTKEFKSRVESIKTDVSQKTKQEHLSTPSFSDLTKALVAPFGWFVRYQLHTAMLNNKVENNLGDLEPFEVNPLNQYSLLQTVKNQTSHPERLTQFISAEQLEKDEEVVSGIFSELGETKLNKKITPVFNAFLRLTKELQELNDVPDKTSSISLDKDLTLPVVTPPRIIPTDSANGDIWAFDLNRELIQVPLMFNGVQVGFRGLKQKIKDVIQLFLQHIVMSFIPKYKGAIMLNSPFGKEYEDGNSKKKYLLTFSKFNRTDALELWQHYHSLFDLASCLPLPLLDDKTSLKVIELIEKQDFDQIKELIIDREYEKPSEGFNRQVVKIEWILKEHPNYVIEVYRAMFDPIKKYSHLTSHPDEAIAGLNLAQPDK